MVMTVLEGFHHIIARWIAGMTAWRGDVGEWEWALVDEVLEVTGIWPMREYVRRRQATIVECFIGRKIYEMYTGEERMEASSRFLRWWHQEHVPTQVEREVG